MSAKPTPEFPQQVQQFVAALIANAKQSVPEWAECDLKRSDGKMECFADTIPHVERKDSNTVVVCDNYERFFSTIYTHTDGADGGTWTVRSMHSDAPAREYSFAKCMADAAIMFTG